MGHGRERRKGVSFWSGFPLWVILILLCGIVQNVEAATISGQATDPLGNAVSGVTVRLTINWGSSTPPCIFPTSKQTSLDGTFTFDVPCLLTPRPFTVTPTKTNYVFSPSRRTGTISGSDTISGLNFEAVNRGDYRHITRLLKVSQSCGTFPNRIPLILIHGIHGSDGKALGEINTYWNTFINFFRSSSSLCSSFELYTFQYYSDLPNGAVKDLARGLEFWLTYQGLNARQKALLAHSMGGLIGWSYLNEWGGNDTTLRFITLGTPFHGSPAANETARNNLGDTFYPPWRVSRAFDAVDPIFWGPFSDPADPNRSDVRYDNYDCYLPNYQGDEVNTWLRGLNQVGACPQVQLPQVTKVFPYAGYLSVDDPDRPSTIDETILTQLDAFRGVLLGKNKTPHQLLAITAALMDHGLGLQFNDGLVPLGSAWFEGRVPQQNRRTFPNCDHQEFITNVSGVRGSTAICRDAQGSSVFGRLTQDLMALHSSSITVTSPNGGEAWQAGTVQTIRWTYAGNPGSSVKIELFKGGVLNSTIKASISIGSGGNGSSTWTIPSTQTAGTNYRIRITSTYNATYQDTSNGDFTINTVLTAPSLTAATPKCDGVSPGIELQWTAVSGASNYQIYRDGSLIYTTQTAGTTFWNVVGLTAGQSYTYQVKAVQGSATSGFSNSRAATAPSCAAPAAPAITSITPQSVTVGGGGFILTVTGNNFDPTTKLLWAVSGQTPTLPLTPTFLNSSTLTVQITQTSQGFEPFYNPGNYALQAQKVVQGGDLRSNIVLLTVLNPAPLVSSISGSCRAGFNCTPVNGFDVKINGSGFVNNNTSGGVRSTYAEINGNSTPVSILGEGPVTSSMQLFVNGSLIPTPGTYSVKVCNEGTGSGTACSFGSLNVTP